MKLLVFVLNKEELLDDVLEVYVEAGIPGATILDSRVWEDSLPMKFPSLPTSKIL